MAEKTKVAKSAKAKKGSGKFFKFFRDIVSETKKITWPTGKTVLNNTIVVIVSVLVIGAFIWALDAILANGLKFLLEWLAGLSK